MWSKSTRTEEDVVADLLALTTSPGYAHAIAAICVRDNLVVYRDELKASDMERVHQPSRLLRTEIATLLGFMTRSDLELSIPPPQKLASYMSSTDALMQELHDAMAAPIGAAMLLALKSGAKEDMWGGATMREPIFYGSESAYHFQYRDLAPEKYGQDDAWLIANKGFSTIQARDIARTMVEQMNERGSDLFSAASRTGQQPVSWLSMFEYRADDLAFRSGVALAVVESFMKIFTVPGKNEGFNTVGDFNEVVAAPLIPAGKGSVLLFDQYSMFEALYESPFYWMWADKAYRPTANLHRGAFTEKYAARRLATVFGRKNVLANVKLLKGKTVSGEVDVLVIFGDRVIVIQAKAKKLTLEARKGNDGQLKKDFAAAIQDSYDQGWECAKAIGARHCRLEDDQGNEVQLPQSIKEVLILNVVSEHYPALAFQARQYLTFQSTDIVRPPLVMDVFLLDALTELLSSPLRLLHYLRMRVEVGEKLMVSHEFTALAYHLKLNLWPQDEFSMMMLDDSISLAMDTAMTVRRDGHAGERTPPGILTKFVDTPFARVIAHIEERAEPGLLEFGFLLLSLGEEAVFDFNGAYDAIVRKGRADGSHHNVTLQIAGAGGGVTLHFNQVASAATVENLRTYCERRKYVQHSARWFGLSMGADGELQFAVGIEFPWERSVEMDALTEEMSKGFSDMNVLRKFAREARGTKVGRNSPCPCGSGKKYKRCCLQ